MEKKKEKRIFPIATPALVLFALGLLGAFIHLFSFLFPSFADFINEYPGAALRFILAKILYCIHFKNASYFGINT